LQPGTSKLKLKTFTREQLFFRHKLSHQQIDDLQQENECANFPESKAQSLAKWNEFLILTKLFTEAGIEFTNLKGALLSYRLYNDPLYRRFGDIDFLIDIQSVEKAIILLKKRGYKCENFEFPTQKRRKKLLIQHKNEIILFNSEKGISIDLHWSLFRKLVAPSESIEEQFASHQTSLKYEGRPYRVFEPEFELLYLIFHGTWHCWNSLKWLVDVQKMLKLHIIDEEKFNQLVEETKSYRLVGLCNVLLTDFFPDAPRIPGASRAPDYLVTFSRKCIYEDDERNLFDFWSKLRTVRFLMNMFPDLIYKINVFKILLFPFDQINNPLIPPYAFFFYLTGPFFKLWKRLFH